MRDWIDPLTGRIVVDIKRELQAMYKATLISIALGVYWESPKPKKSGTLPPGLGHHLLFGGDPDTMPTSAIQKEIKKLKQEVHVDLANRFESGLKTLQSSN